jgi:hypothetical protein
MSLKGRRIGTPNICFFFVSHGWHYDAERKAGGVHSITEPEASELSAYSCRSNGAGYLIVEAVEKP